MSKKSLFTIVFAGLLLTVAFSNCHPARIAGNEDTLNLQNQEQKNRDQSAPENIQLDGGTIGGDPTSPNNYALGFTPIESGSELEEIFLCIKLVRAVGAGEKNDGEAFFSDSRPIIISKEGSTQFNADIPRGKYDRLIIWVGEGPGCRKEGKATVRLKNSYGAMGATREFRFVFIGTFRIRDSSGTITLPSAPLVEIFRNIRSEADLLELETRHRFRVDFTN